LKRLKFSGEGNGEMFIAILILITTLGCNHATIITSCRVYYAMAKEGLFFKKAGQLNSYAVPGNSLLMQCVWACPSCFIWDI
jgi:APA family basic amino acid/polyamine antiporter